MLESLAGLAVAVIGGDLRQLAVAKAIAGLAGQARTYGLPNMDYPGLAAVSSVREALDGAAAVVLPITRVDADGRVSALPGQPVVTLDADFWGMLAKGALILAGTLPAHSRRLAETGGGRVIEYAENDEIAILNSIPTAEGALRLAMQELPITIHGCCCFVLGFGRVGQTTARLFSVVGAETWVVANRPALRARAREMQCRSIPFAELEREADRADLVINTVPALVVPEHVLARTKPSVFLIDLASAPGGLDFAAAAALGRRAVLALGLPGKFTPESAGRILAETLPAIILKELG